jgi:hypothetical protein
LPARIKKQQLAELSQLGQLANKGPFYRHMNALLKKHGCDISTHYVNEKGWIVARQIA